MQKITGSDVYSYVVCHYKAYLEFFGDKSKRIPLSDFIKTKFKEGIDYEKEILKDKTYTEIIYNQLSEGIDKTEKELKKKTELIYRGVLQYKNLIGKPDLLRKVGNHYEPVEIKLGKSLKETYKFQVLFYALILQKIQGIMPENGYVILGNGKEVSFSIKDELPRFLEIFDGLEKIAYKENKPTPKITSTCKLCAWKEHCKKIAVRNDDLSLLYGITKKGKDFLINHNIDNIKKLFNADINQLPLESGITINSLNKWKLQAQSLVHKKVIWLNKPKLDTNALYFDIEGETQIGIDYLYGVLKDDKYISFLADKPEDEERMWKSFIDYIKDFDGTIYHYAPYEVMSIKRLAKKYGCEKELLDKIIHNMVDLFSVLKKSAVLPIYSYSIKDVAKYLGFQWSNKKASGSQSLCWYSDWLKTGDDKFLNLILEYNRDDVIATKVVHEFLNN